MTELRFYAELYVAQQPATVWRYFSDLRQWSRWSPICLDCRLANGSQLGVGSVLRINFRALNIGIVVPATVMEMNAPHLITWTGAKFGLRARHTYRFESRGSGTLMSNEERICGASFPFSSLIKNWYRHTDLSYQSLAGLKRELEKAL